ncbi:hypothetical protein CMV_012777 [Castanea mollissima]|uniref:Uncharacterized protein n=1 Tax=Castanea mollissima TaxID=60419 RepID=A0A8J4REP8_9ROSI|nr:hypothetical protein CMV_012777 [Castanea mollissima]
MRPRESFESHIGDFPSYYATDLLLQIRATLVLSVSGVLSLTKKLLVVHVRRHADHVDDVLRHDHVGVVLCHHDEHAGDVLRRDQDEHMGDVLRHHDEHVSDVLCHHDEHMGDVLRHEHVVDVLHHHDNALLLHEDHDHDRRDAHRHHDNALLFRHVQVLHDVLRHDQVHVQVLHDVPLPHCGGEYDDDFRGETFSKVLLKSKLDQEVSL